MISYSYGFDRCTPSVFCWNILSLVNLIATQRTFGYHFMLCWNLWLGVQWIHIKEYGFFDFLFHGGWRYERDNCSVDWEQLNLSKRWKELIPTWMKILLNILYQFSISLYFHGWNWTEWMKQVRVIFKASWTWLNCFIFYFFIFFLFAFTSKVIDIF